MQSHPGHNLTNTRPHQLRWGDKERNLEFGKELKTKYILELAQKCHVVYMQYLDDSMECF